MAIKPTAYEQSRQMSMASGYSRATGKKLPLFYSGVAPFGVAGAGASAGSAIKRLFGGAKNIITRQSSNPFAGLSIKQGLQNIGKTWLGRLLKVGIGYGSFQLGKSAITGEKIDILPNVKASLAFAMNPLLGGAGLATGTVEKFVLPVLSRPDLMSLKDQFPNVPSASFTPTTTNVFNMPSSPQATGGLMPSPTASYTAPSVSISGGGGGIPPELLLLLFGGVAGGYLLGRRKRKKKKKSKKRRY